MIHYLDDLCCRLAASGKWPLKAAAFMIFGMWATCMLSFFITVFLTAAMLPFVVLRFAFNY